MIYTNTSLLSGKEYSMSLPIDEEEFYKRYSLWKSHLPIQEAFPMLDANQREFIMTGITPQEWEQLFAGSDVDE